MTTARRRRCLLALASALAVAGCRAAPVELKTLDESPTGIARAARLALALADTPSAADTASARGAPLAQWQLPKALQELSGLALTADGRLFTHGDELGQVWEVDYRRGILVKAFSLGNEIVKGDFESIAVVGERLFLFTSKGALYEFREGANGTKMPFTITDTGLGTECEFEGMAFDATLNALLFACKQVHTKAFKDDLVIFRWSLTDSTTARLSRLAIPMARVIGDHAWKTLRPSDITVDPFTGNYVLLASAEHVIFAVTPKGDVVFARPLPNGHHQAEGIAITRDHLLILSDEGGQQPAIITLYRWP
jgi:uncharacterized protein YjiK